VFAQLLESVAAMPHGRDRGYSNWPRSINPVSRPYQAPALLRLVELFLLPRRFPPPLLGALPFRWEFKQCQCSSSLSNLRCDSVLAGPFDSMPY
jgi:hypothetical protein